MDQIKTGLFLRELRKEKNMTQEKLAEQFRVSNRTISRWETGTNMPDIGMLTEIAEFYDVSIPEIINGERKSGNMNQETKETAAAMTEYSRNEVKNGKHKIAGILMSAFGGFVIISAMSVFPAESSWSSIYSVIGSIVLIAGIYLLSRNAISKRLLRILAAAGSAAALFATFAVSDYVAVTQFNQVPRFRYESAYDSRAENQITYKTLFFTAVRENPGTKDERVYILK